MPHGVSPASLATAFALVLVAGLCAPLGACVVLLVKKDHTTLLAPSLSLAAGVMILVALAEVGSVALGRSQHAPLQIMRPYRAIGHTQPNNNRHSASTSTRTGAQPVHGRTGAQLVCSAQSPLRISGGYLSHRLQLPSSTDRTAANGSMFIQGCVFHKCFHQHTQAHTTATWLLSAVFTWCAFFVCERVSCVPRRAVPPLYLQAFFFGVALCRVLDKLADVAVSIMTRATANKRPAHKRQRVQEQQCQDALQDEHFVDVSSVLPAASTLSPPLRNPAGKACVAGSTSNLQLAARDVKTNATNNANCSDLETGFCLDSGVSSCCPVAPSPPGTAGTAASPLGGVAVGQEQQQQEAASGGVAVGGGGGNRGDEGADGSDGCEDATEGRSAAGDDGCCQLMRTSILVWLALSLHNLPEGLGTFVG